MVPLGCLLFRMKHLEKRISTGSLSQVSTTNEPKSMSFSLPNLRNLGTVAVYLSVELLLACFTAAAC